MLKRLFRKLSQDEGDRRAATIREWAGSVSGATPISHVRAREAARVAGVIESLRVRPREGLPVLEAVVGDGSGTVTAVWLGRRQIPGVVLGARVVLEGRFGGSSTGLQVMNPTFEFAPREDEY